MLQMSLVKSLVRQRFPWLHGRAMATNQSVTRLRRAPERRRARRVFASSSAVRFAMIENAGLGGLLLQAASAIELGRREGVEVALQLESPIYAPAGHSGDWLDLYFDRLGPVPRVDVPRIVLTDLVHSHAPHLPLEIAAELVWSQLRICDDIRQYADEFAVSDYAGVHYRGSDKRYESPRVCFDVVLDRVRREMDCEGLSKLFVASDELEFVAEAKRRFGGRAFTIPQRAVAVDGLPPHFSTVGGEIKAKEALTTMLLLGNARVLVRTESYLSAWAHTLNSNQRAVVVRA
jgi:hypothetical protein